jgi:predicted anti-sigma-YlaC factor YlaD
VGYGDEEISQELKNEIRQHLEDCPSCRMMMNHMQGLKHHLKSLHADIPLPRIRKKVMRKIWIHTLKEKTRKFFVK